MAKRELYKVLIERMEAAHATNNLLGAAWYAYAILEDRLVSLLRNSGGLNDKNGQPLRLMMGPKFKELKRRVNAKSQNKHVDPLLRINVELTTLDKWIDQRNKLMHGIAEGELTIEEIDTMIAYVAGTGIDLVRDFARAAARVKKHRKQFPLPA